MPLCPGRRLCSFHRTGVPYPDVLAADFYEPGCRRCEEKRRAGVITGREPAPAELETRLLAALRGLHKREDDWTP